MTNEQLRLQMLSGIITESEYKAKLNENKKSLNEHYVAGGIVGIGAINQIPSRTKEVYEDAFEHFLGERYQLKPNRERDDIKDINEEEDVEEGKEVEEPSLYEGELNESVGNTLEKLFQSVEFSQKGNDELIEFGEYLLSPEGPKKIAMSIKQRLKGSGGEDYFTSDPERLQSFLSKIS
jgi:hypothetical protein